MVEVIGGASSRVRNAEMSFALVPSRPCSTATVRRRRSLALPARSAEQTSGRPHASFLRQRSARSANTRREVQKPFPATVWRARVPDADWVTDNA
jgi:hypothetical protein